MLRLLLFGRQVYLKYSMDEMSVYAAQASFFIIMAAFPFFMVLLALIQVAPMIHEADLLRFLLPAIPGRFQGLLIYLLFGDAIKDKLGGDTSQPGGSTSSSQSSSGG